MTAVPDEPEAVIPFTKAPPGDAPLDPDTPLSENDDATISFAKRLAHNDKQIREAALKKVKRWLVTKSKHGTLDYENIIKIWKGLHYSMWYSDKMLTQEALALDISQTILLFSDKDHAVKFFSGFCETIAREWVGIDRQRLDKYYMFIKTALKCVLEFCQVNKWDDAIVEAVVTVLDVRIINSTCPDSIAVFISEQFYSVYSEFYSAAVPSLFVTKLLMAYITAISNTPKRDLNRVIMTNLFTPVAKSEVNFNIDVKLLLDHIYTVSTHSDILTRNRKLLYKLRSQLSTVLGGHDISPLGKRKAENGDENTDSKRKVESGDENTDSNVDNGVEATKTKKKKKKLKSAVKKEDVKEDGPGTVIENKTVTNGVTCDIVEKRNLKRNLKQELEEELETSQEGVTEEVKPEVDVTETEPSPAPETKAAPEEETAPEEEETWGSCVSVEEESEGLPDIIEEPESESPVVESTPAATPVANTYVSPVGVKRSKRNKSKGGKTPVQPLPQTPVQPPPQTPEEQTTAKRKRRKSKKVEPVTPTTPEATPTPLGAKKKVRLSMENNQTFVFKKNTSMDSPTPFDFNRTPNKSALKLSPAVTRSQLKSKAKSRVRR